MSGLPSIARLSVFAAAAMALGGCDSGEPPIQPPVPAPTAAAKPPEPAPTPKQTTSFSSEDGAALSGDIYPAAPEAPSLVLVHRLLGDRNEWTPLVEQLRRAKLRYSILAFDLRSHGGSKPPVEPGKRRQDDQKRELALDVRAAIKHVGERSGGKSKGVVLVGSSFGSTLISLVAFEEPSVTALALISPGAAIRGVDVYRPYSEVRNLPTFLAAAEGDTVSKDPMDALSRMAMQGTVKRYSGARHGAQFLAEEHATLWTDLAVWLGAVYDKAPEERRSLYYAPGKEPKARNNAAGARARGGG